MLNTDTLKSLVKLDGQPLNDETVSQELIQTLISMCGQVTHCCKNENRELMIQPPESYPHFNANECFGFYIDSAIATDKALILPILVQFKHGDNFALHGKTLQIQIIFNRRENPHIYNFRKADLIAQRTDFFGNANETNNECETIKNICIDDICLIVKNIIDKREQSI